MGRCERGSQCVHTQAGGEAAGRGASLPVPGFVAEQPVLDVPYVLFSSGAVSGFGPCGVEEVGEGGHVEGERIPVGIVFAKVPWRLQGFGGGDPVVAGQAWDSRECGGEGAGGVEVVADAPVGFALHTRRTCWPASQGHRHAPGAPGSRSSEPRRRARDG
ncbi:hypothetical protein B6R96_34050 [Streptomyces sp. Sge12]|nr:hypothetical protein B6R96_34050 [Streptomyces sp. Sge12]